MVSSTPCCNDPAADTARRGVRRRRLGVLLVAPLLGPLAPVLHAQEPPPATVALEVERTPDAGVFLSTTVPLRLPRVVENALRKGIAMHFVVQAQVLQRRWYWSDKVQAEATRYLRLSYQPLTRRWRLSQSSTPIAASGLGMALGQNYDALEEALAAMQRISRWQIAEVGELDDDTAYTVRFEYRLDTSQLPRPLQWGAVGGANWSLHLEGSAPLPALPPRGAEAGS